MSINSSDSQTLFIAFFAIFLALMTQLANGSRTTPKHWFNQFDTTAVFLEGRVFIRFIFAFTTLTFIPLVYLYAVLFVLKVSSFELTFESNPSNIALNLLRTMLLGYLALAPVGFYRINRGLLFRLKKYFYDEKELKWGRKKDQKLEFFPEYPKTQQKWQLHVIPGLIIYIILPFCLLVFSVCLK